MSPEIDPFRAAIAIAEAAENPSAEMQRVGRRLRKFVGGRPDLVTHRIHLVSSFLTGMLADAVSAALLRWDMVVALTESPYGALPSALIAGDVPPDLDLLLLLPTHRDLLYYPGLGASAADVVRSVRREVRFWSKLWPVGVPCVQLNFDPPAFRLQGEADGLVPGGTLHYVRAVNQALAACTGGQVAIVDAEALAGTIGPAWHDARTYALCKQPFRSSAIPDVATALASSVAGLLGGAKKVLVLDLDNTLWGGVVGDVGIEQLVLGPETPEGEAFTSLQRYVRGLSERGVILAVCSKNNDAIAREAFEKHSGMVLKMNDIAVFMANFDDKAQNIREIARYLNVGLNSLVFVDDNPVERAWVRGQLPDVLVVELPANADGYVGAIERTRPFPAHRITHEDRSRSQSYQARNALAEADESGANMDEFLAQLAPEAIVSGVELGNRDRILQLIAKTNQFKTSPELFTADQLSDPVLRTIAISLSDRMQSYGIVAVCVYEVAGSVLQVRQWVMSCRVFSRRLEHVMVEVLQNRARVAGCSCIIVPFTRSGRNEVARDFLFRLGFAHLTSEMLSLQVDQVLPEPHFMTISRETKDE